MCCDFDDKIYTAECAKCGAAIDVHWGNKRKIAPHIVRVGDKVKPSERGIVARELAVARWNKRAESRKDFCTDAYTYFRAFVHTYCPEANLFFEDIFDDDSDAGTFSEPKESGVTKK